MALAITAGALSYWLLERPTMLPRRLFTAEGQLAQRYAEKQRS